MLSIPASIHVVITSLGSNDNGHEPNEARLSSNQKECYDCCRRPKATLNLLWTKEPEIIAFGVCQSHISVAWISLKHKNSQFWCGNNLMGYGICGQLAASG